MCQRGVGGASPLREKGVSKAWEGHGRGVIAGKRVTVQRGRGVTEAWEVRHCCMRGAGGASSLRWMGVLAVWEGLQDDG